MEKINKDAILKDINYRKKIIIIAALFLVVIATIMIVAASYVCKFQLLKLFIITFMTISVSVLLLLELNNRIILMKTLETMLDNYSDVYTDGNDGLFRKISGFISIYFRHLTKHINDDKYTKYTEGVDNGNREDQ